ncbi:type II secretion system protein [Aeromonas caviae]|uniref:type II secretion system protein n=1 Tax=Aeromonas caviae TaxID=648 RepID=UPI00191FD295|nr:type II secretion system protein [Aeromonas caviae]MBL0555977.1 type II secretion system protein [Aeromonas caviae]MDH0027216.1 type II secretion system GspH family protein [Aeromonas caviae]MDH0238928.1 type II secretion system GspH family protein [Aeromonas caviae]MDH1078989.1 type II secretion system GspH family protein [Aeromonas caviae]USP62692.1 type II secretion system protein [Aeromonas caviae]
MGKPHSRDVAWEHPCARLACYRVRPGREGGFTLVELVMVILLLGVMATFSSQFIGIGTQIYGDASRREQLMSDARFALERLNREVRDAVPGSVRVEDEGGGAQEQGACLRFWPIATASRYLSLNKSVAGNFELTMVASSAGELPTDGYRAVVYPITGEGGLEAGCIHGKCVANVVGDGSFEPTTKIGTVTVDAAFDRESPAKRIYFANQQVRYCIDTQGTLMRYRESTHALMAEHIRPSESYFYRDPAAFSSSEVGLRLEFEQRDERVLFNHKLETLNVP